MKREKEWNEEEAKNVYTERERERERETVKKRINKKCFTLQKYLKHASHYAARV